MAIKDILAKGIGFLPGSTKWIATHGFGVGEEPVPPVVAISPRVGGRVIHRSTGLTILAQDPLFYSTRTYSERITPQVSGYSHEIRSIGGYFSARITINASKKKIEDWIDYGLGRHIVVYSPSLVVIFEGFVNSIQANLGPLQFTVGPLLDIKNRVAVTYSTVDTSVSPPGS